MTTLKNLALFAGLATAGLVSVPALAADAPASPHTLTANVGIYSQYVFRGLTQTNGDPAVQGGFDYSHTSGVYLGTWASNISWLRENLTGSTPSSTYKSGGSMEWDFYGGYKGSVGDFGYDVGLLQYYYPGDVNTTFIKANTLEAYAAGSWKWFTLKYSQSITDKTFGVNKSSGTYYVDLSGSFPIGESGFTLGAHYGIQKYKGKDPINTNTATNDDLYSYNDWKVSLAYDMSKVAKTFDGMTMGVAYTDTSSANKCGYGKSTDTDRANNAACTGVYPKNIANGTTSVWIAKTF